MCPTAFVLENYLKETQVGDGELREDITAEDKGKS